LKKFRRVWSGDIEIGENSLFPGTFGGFLKSLEGEKGPHITNREKII